MSKGANKNTEHADGTASATATVRPPWWRDFGKRKIDQASYKYGVAVAAGALFLSDFIFDNALAYIGASILCFVVAKYFHSRIKSA